MTMDVIDMIDTLYDCFRHWSEKGSVYILSDPHFNEEDVSKWRANNISDDELVSVINRTVHKNDTLIILGDVGDTNYIKRLNAGYKILVTGNHDKGKDNYIRKEWIGRSSFEQKSFTEFEKEMLKKDEIVFYDGELKDTYKYMYKKYILNEAIKEFSKTVKDFSSAKCKYEECTDSWYWEITYDNHLFDEVYTGPLFISDKILLSHEPIDLPYVLNIHGHDHCDEYDIIGKHINCCAEKLGYLPISLSDIIKTGILKDIPSIHRLAIDKQKGRSKEC